MFNMTTLWFLIFMLVVGTILEFVLHRRQVRFIKKQLDSSEQEARAADHLVADLITEQLFLISERDAARAVADAAEKQTVIYHDANKHLVATATLRNRIMADLSQTVQSMTVTHELLLDEVERLNIERIMAELNATPILGVESRQTVLDMAQARKTGGHDA